MVRPIVYETAIAADGNDVAFFYRITIVFILPAIHVYLFFPEKF